MLELDLHAAVGARERVGVERVAAQGFLARLY